MLAWEPVDGAASYRLAALINDSSPYWAWLGDATEVRFGGAPEAGGHTAIVFEPMTWRVITLDADGLPIAASDPGMLPCARLAAPAPGPRFGSLDMRPTDRVRRPAVPASQPMWVVWSGSTWTTTRSSPGWWYGYASTPMYFSAIESMKALVGSSSMRTTVPRISR